MKIPGTQKLKKILLSVNRIGIILMYHRVANLEYDPLCLNVTPKHLEEQVQVLKKYGRCVQMQGMGKNLRRFAFGEVDIAITLDDGYADNFYNAKPIFEKADVPATFFIITGSVDSREEFFWDGLIRTVLAPKILPSNIEIIIANDKYHWVIEASGPCQSVHYGQSITGIPSNGSKLSRFQLYDAILQLLGPLSADPRQLILKHLSEWSGQALTVRKDCLPMSSNDLMNLRNCSLFEIGAHTVNHPRLAALSIKAQEKEINHSKTELERKFNKPIVSFSYPHGSYSKDTVNLVKRLKFQNACTVISNPVMRNADPYILPRFAVQDWNGDEFERNLCHWLSIYN